MTNTDHLRLRLAARALVEWRTPVASSDYRSVLHDLLSDHRHAAAHIVASRDEILECDQQGSFLLYLAHTNASSHSAYAGRTFDEYRQSALWRLSRFELLADYYGAAQQSAAERYRLSETILAAIDSTDNDVSLLGHKVLIAVGIPFESRVRERLIASLFHTMAGQPLPILREIGRWVRNSEARHFFELLVTIIGLVLTVILTGELFPNEMPLSFRHALIAGSGCLIGVPFLVLEVVLKSTSGTSLTGAVVPNVDNETRSWLIRLKSPYADISEQKLARAMGEIVAVSRTVLYTLAIERSTIDWLQFALQATPRAGQEIIQEALYLLRLNEVKERQRVAIVEWLSRVHVET